MEKYHCRMEEPLLQKIEDEFQSKIETLKAVNVK